MNSNRIQNKYSHIALYSSLLLTSAIFSFSNPVSADSVLYKNGPISIMSKLNKPLANDVADSLNPKPTIKLNTNDGGGEFEVSVASPDTINLYNHDGETLPGRTLTGGTSWLTPDLMLDYNNSEAYYRVSTLEYARLMDGGLKPSDKAKIFNPKVRFVDENGNSIHKELSFEAYAGDSYDLSASILAIEGYSFEKSVNTTGTIDEDKTITYVYRKLKAEPLSIKYVNQNGDEIKARTTIDAEYNTTYNYDKTTAPTIEGYKIKSVENGVGVFDSQSKTMTYIYEGNEVSYNIHYWNQSSDTPLPAGEIKNSDIYSLSSKDISGQYTGRIGDIVETNRGTQLIDKKGYSYINIFDYKNNISGEQHSGVWILEPDTKDIYITFTLVQAPSTKITETYVDENGNPIANEETQTGPDNTSIQLNGELNIPNYEYDYDTLDNNPDKLPLITEMNNSVSHTVVHHYKTRKFNVPIKYVDENGTSIKQDSSITGKYNTDYNYTNNNAPTIEGYTIKNVLNGTGKFGGNSEPIVYEYTANKVSIPVDYVDDRGNTINPSKAIEGSFNTSYNYSITDAPKIAGYTINKIENGAGIFKGNNPHIVYKYTVNDAKLTINYLDKESGIAVRQPQIINGKYGDIYSFNPEDNQIDNYDFTSVDKQNITLSDSHDNTINVYYSRQHAPLTFKYMDENGNEIAQSKTITGNVGSTYSYSNSEADILLGYEIMSTENGKGIIEKNGNTIIFRYKAKDIDPNIATDYLGLTVKYVNEKGEELRPSLIQSILVNEKYSTNPVEIQGYHLVKSTNNHNGVMSAPTTVIYSYERNDSKGVLINYMSDDGKTLVKSETIKGKTGDKYTSAPKNIDNYTLVATPDNAEGILEDNETVVNYIYKENSKSSVIISYTNEDGTKLADNVITNGYIGSRYTTSPLSIPHYTLTANPENANGSFLDTGILVNYVYKLNRGNIIIKYIDQNGHLIHEDISKSGKYGELYNIDRDEVLSIDGYTFDSIKDGNGVFDDEQTKIVEIIYNKDSKTSTVVPDPDNPTIPEDGKHETTISKPSEEREITIGDEIQSLNNTLKTSKEQDMSKLETKDKEALIKTDSHTNKSLTVLGTILASIGLIGLTYTSFMKKIKAKK